MPGLLPNGAAEREKSASADGPTLRALRGDGSGTITFGSNSAMVAFYANSGLGFFSRRGAAIAPAFEDIPDVRIVADTIDEARRET